MTELKPCPWCGQIPEIREHNISMKDPNFVLYSVECMNNHCACMPGTNNCYKPEDAAEIWNRRADNNA